MFLQQFFYQPFIRVFLLVLLSYLLSSCTKSDADSAATLEKAATFFKQLPIEAADSSIALIEKHIQHPTEKYMIYEFILNRLAPLPPPTGLRYIAYLEKNIPSNKPDLIGYVTVLKGRTYFNIGKIDSSFILVLSGIEQLKKGTDSLKISLSYLQLSRLYLTENAVLLGTEAALTGLQYYPKQTEGVNRTYNELRLSLLASYVRSNAYKEAKILANTLFETHNVNDSIELYGTLGTIFAKLNQTDSAIWAIEKQAVIFHKTINDQSMYGFMNMGACWYHAKQYEKAISCLLTAKQMADSLHDVGVSLNSAFMLGKVYLALGDLSKAEAYFAIVSDNKNFQRNKSKFKMLYENLLTLKFKKADDKDGLLYVEKVKALADSITQKDNHFVWANLNSRYKASEKENKIQELLLDKKQLYIQGLFLCLCLCIGIGFIYTNRQKNKLLVQENSLLIVNKEASAMREKMQEAELNAHKKELTDFSQKIAEKNALIDDIEKQLDGLREQASVIVQEEILANKAKLQDMKILTEKDWGNYLRCFENVYPNFVKKVSGQFPDLTEGELRLFLMIYMDMDKDEIAGILGISLDGVKKNRHRLRKKLNIAQDDNIYEYVKNFLL